MHTVVKGALAAAGLVLGLAVVVRPAAAGPITVTYEGVNPGVGNAGQINWNTGSVTHEGILYTPRGNGSSSDNHFISFCIERVQALPGGTHTYDLVDLGGDTGPAGLAAAADSLRAMWAEYRPGLDTAEQSSAFQHAIWHLLDPTYNPSLSAAERGYYNAYLDSGTWLSGLADLAILFSDTLQDQLLERGPRLPEGPAEVVPTPAPPALLVAAVLAPALLVRRRLAPKAG